MKLSKHSVQALALPAGVWERTFFDSGLAGFGVRLRASGHRTFIVQYRAANKRTRRVVLGETTAVDLTWARETAKDILARVRLGADPAGERAEIRAKPAITFGGTLARYLAHKRTAMKPRSFDEIVRHLELHAKPFHNRAVEAIDRRAVAVRLAEIAEDSGPGAANRVRSSLVAYFTWLLKEGLLEGNNPAAFTNRAVENEARSRLLTDDELKRIWRALDDGQYSSIVRLLILTGVRRAEIADLRWSEVDFDNALITLGPARTKTKREFQIPLTPAAVAILKAQPRRTDGDGNVCEFIFGNGNRGWTNFYASKIELDARISKAGEPMPDWCLHDFRRLVSTRMNETLGVMPFVVEGVLGHTVRGIAGVYNKASYLEQRHAAVVRWGEYVEALVSGKRPATVVKLRRRTV